MRITRTSPAAPVAAEPANDDPLNNRRARIQRVKEEKQEAIRESGVEIVECPVDDSFLTEIIDRAPREIRPMRPGDYLHVSDLLGKCVRKIVLCNRYSTPTRPQRLSASDLFTFAQGDAIHDTLKAMASASSPQQVWGKWRCKCGNIYHDEPCTLAETDPDDICEYCGTPTNVYEEVPMRDDDTMIVGTPDLLLYIAALRAFHISEIKSISHDQWKDLARPKPEHVLQVLFYWYLMRKLGYRVTDRVSIIYVTKNYVFQGRPYKEFMFNPERELHRLDDYIADAYAAKAARKDKNAKLPSRTCTGEYTVEAKKCEVCEICWSKE